MDDPHAQESPRTDRGFSMAELLVAITIFMILMAGLTVLFSGAVNSVRQSYRTRDAYEIARGIFSVVDRDLKAAFTSRELGDFFQFYGREDAFMFVGVLQDGELGRVTYVLHDITEVAPYDATIADSWWTIFKSAVPDGIRYRNRRGARLDNLNDPNVNTFIGHYPFPCGNNVRLSECIAANNAAAIVDFPVRITTKALVRYEERGRADLSTFTFNEEEQFLLDNPNPNEFPSSNFEDLTPEANNLRTQFNDIKRREAWLNKIKFPNEQCGDEDERRRANRASNCLPNGEPVQDYIVGDSIMSLAQLKSAGGSNLLYLYGAPRQPMEVFGTTMFQYGNGGRIKNSDGEDTDHEQFSATYGTCANVRDVQINIREDNCDNVPFEDKCDCLISGLDFNRGPYFEAIFGRRKARQPRSLGSPIEPRIPALLSIGFWVVAERATPGSPDFRRWFSQDVDIPSGFTRKPPPNV